MVVPGGGGVSQWWWCEPVVVPGGGVSQWRWCEPVVALEILDSVAECEISELHNARAFAPMPAPRSYGGDSGCALTDLNGALSQARRC